MTRGRVAALQQRLSAIHARLQARVENVNRRHALRAVSVNARLDAIEQQQSAQSVPSQSVVQNVNTCGTDDSTQTQTAALAQETARLRVLSARKTIELAMFDAGLSEDASTELFDKISEELANVTIE